jgi:hypothetical protein
MTECRWVTPVLAAQLEFVGWTDVHHLLHAEFIAFRDYKRAKEVRRE